MQRPTLRTQRSLFWRTCETVIWLAVVSITLVSTESVTAQRVESIERKQFQTYLWWLDLNEEDRELAEIFYKDFKERSDTEILDRARAYHRGWPDYYSEAYWKRLKERSEERRKLMADYAELAAVLFRDLAWLLPEDGRHRIRRVENARLRHLYRASPGDLPMARVDLASLLVGMPLSPEERKSLDTVLDEYEPILLDALRARQSAHEEAGVYTVRVVAKSRELDQRTREDGLTLEEAAATEESLSRDDAREKWARIYEPHTQRLAQINREWLGRIEAAITEENAAAYRQRVLEAAYERIYPDPAHADALYEAAYALEDLTDEQRAVLETLHDEFRRAHRLISIEMRDIDDRQHGARLSASRDEWGYEFQGMTELAEAGLKREQLNEAQLAKISLILTPEQVEKLPEWDFEENPRKRPYDRMGHFRRMEQHERRLREIEERRRD